MVLRWHLQTGTIVIPKSVTPSRIKENLDVFGFELDADDLAAFAALDEGSGSARTRPSSTPAPERVRPPGAPTVQAVGAPP